MHWSDNKISLKLKENALVEIKNARRTKKFWRDFRKFMCNVFVLLVTSVLAGVFFICILVSRLII